MGGIGFTPQGVYLLAQVPNEYYEDKKDLILNDATKKSMRKEYIEKGDKLIVAATGDGCNFVKPGDYISVNGRGMMELELDGIEEPFVLVRESEVLGKFD